MLHDRNTDPRLVGRHLDDGEWISWEWINSQLYAQELQEEFPHAGVEVIQVFEDLVHAAQTYYESTGRFL